MEPVAHPVSDSYSLRVYHSQKCVRLAQQQCCRILDDWFAVENCGEVRVRDYYPPWMVVSEPCSYVTMGTRTIVSQRLWTMIYTFCSVLHFTLAMRVPKPGFKVLVFFECEQIKYSKETGVLQPTTEALGVVYLVSPKNKVRTSTAQRLTWHNVLRRPESPNG